MQMAIQPSDSTTGLDDNIPQASDPGDDTDTPAQDPTSTDNPTDPITLTPDQVQALGLDDYEVGDKVQITIQVTSTDDSGVVGTIVPGSAEDASSGPEDVPDKEDKGMKHGNARVLSPEQAGFGAPMGDM